MKDAVDLTRLKEEVRREVTALLEGAPAALAHRPAGGARDLVTEADVAAARDRGRLDVAKGALVTPLARDAAARYGVEIVFDGSPRVPTAATPAPSSAPAPRQSPTSRSAPVPEAQRRSSSAQASPASMGGAASMAARKVVARPTRGQVAAGCDHGHATIVAVASDHAGFQLKEAVRRHLEKSGYQVLDFGTDDGKTSVDYPDFIVPAAAAVARGDACRAVLVDCHGNASAMTANKVPGVRAAASRNLEEVGSSREHNDVNVIGIGQKVLSPDAAFEIVDAFLSTAFAGDRHARRIDKVMKVEQAFCGGRS